MVETISFISQLRHTVALKLGFDKWHFYELMDSFERVLLLLDLLYCVFSLDAILLHLCGRNYFVHITVVK